MHLLIDASAKVNLCLLIGPRRPDGYHDLFSIFAPVDLCDRLEFMVTLGPATDGPGKIELDSGGIDEGGEGEQNLAVRALRAVESAMGLAISGRVTIEKHIPVGAGMGGGSSDAAAALRAAARLLDLEAGVRLEHDQLHYLARLLGADVPFFLESGAALAKGIGDILEPILIPELTLVLLLPTEYLGTGEVYGEFDRLAAAKPAPETPEAFAARCAAAESRWRGLEQALAGRTPEPGLVVASALENDLEPASFSLMPGLAARKHALLEAGALGALMSGSGPTMFGVCRTPEDADLACGRLAARGHRALAVRTR